MSDLQIITPPVISASFRQLGILVLDASGSMLDDCDSGSGLTKAQEVDFAVRELITRFKVSRKAPNFSFALVTFHDSVSFVGPPAPLSDLDDSASFDPTASGTGGTFVGAGLEAAGEVARTFLADTSSGLPSSAVILLMSDGECGNPTRTQQVADAIRSDGDISVAAAYLASKGGGTGQGPALLRSIASDPVSLYKTVYDAETLRSFFTASLTAVAGRTEARAEAGR
jgi:hypothetical protein